MTRKTFLLIFAIGAALRIVWINVPPLWYDENFTLLLARLPFAQMLKATMSDVHPPLWYLIEWAWMHIVPNAPAWFIRVPALVCSIASLYVFRLLLDEISIPKQVQTGAMVLMAILPFQLWYAQEGRMYALLELEVLLALLWTLRRDWIGLFVASVAMLYTQNYGMFYLASIGLISLLIDINFRDYAIKVIGATLKTHEYFQRTTMTAGIMLAAFVFYLPWARVIAEQMLGINDRYWIVSKGIGSVLIVIYKLFMTAAVPGEFYFPSYFVTFGVLILGTWHFVQSYHPSRAIVAVMAFAPIVMASVVSYVYQPVLLFRAFIGISPFLYILAVWWVETINIKQVFAAVITLPILASALYGYYANVAAMKGEGAVSSMREALAYVERHWEPGDIIYATDDGPWINLSAYADETIYRMPECDSPVLGSLSVKTRDALGMPTAELNTIPHRRAWIFAPFSPLHPTCYRDQVSDMTANDPAYVVDNNEWLYSAVWLVEEK